MGIMRVGDSKGSKVSFYLGLFVLLTYQCNLRFYRCGYPVSLLNVDSDFKMRAV